MANRPERDRSETYLYDKRWRIVAAMYRARNPLCCGCRAVGRVQATEVVDHVIPHQGNHSLFWDQSNWQPSCRWHHDSVKKRLEVLYAGERIAASELALDSEAAIRITRSLIPD